MQAKDTILSDNLSQGGSIQQISDHQLEPLQLNNSHVESNVTHSMPQHVAEQPFPMERMTASTKPTHVKLTQAKFDLENSDNAN